MLKGGSNCFPHGLNFSSSFNEWIFNHALEVCSPGLDRPLKKEKDFIRYAGYDVEIKLYKPLNGTKQLEGELIGLTEDKKIKVVIYNNEVEFDKKDIALIKLAVKF